MGTGYSRNDTSNNIADGNIINAADLDGEFDAIQSAFNASTGHTHDGTTAEGAPITVTGPAQEYVSSATEFRPKTNNTYDLGSLSLQWKDLYVDGTGYIDSVDIDGGAIDGTTIGGSSAAAGSFTTLGASGNATVGGTLGVTGLSTLASVDINGGNIDGTTIGSASAAAGTFTNLTATGTTTLAGASTTADITFGDNDKAIFGAGSDLQIYHDGAHSYIWDNGTGDLRIKTNGAGFRFLDSGNNYLANFVASAQAELYYNTAKKLATTSTGVDVTGTVTADGLTVDGDTTFNLTSGQTVKIFRSDYATLSLGSDNSNRWDIQEFGSNDLFLARVNAGVVRNALKMEGATGDISFYEDTGTTPKFFWDASAESLTVNSTLKVEGGTTNGFLQASGTSFQLGASTASNLIAYTNNAERMRIEADGDILFGSSTNYAWMRPYEATTGNLIISADNGGTGTSGSAIKFRTRGADKMIIEHSGNVGIGTSSPSATLDIEKSSGNASQLITATANTTRATLVTNAKTSGGVEVKAVLGSYGDASKVDIGTLTNHPTAFLTNNTERMRIDASGNVGIGVVPNATGGGYKALQLGLMTNWAFPSTGSAYRSHNLYYDGTNRKYVTTGTAHEYEQSSAGHVFSTAASGTAGTTVTLSEAMRIDASGNLLVGTTDPLVGSGTGNNTEGLALSAGSYGGYATFSRSGSECLNLNRKTNDGTILNFRKDGTTVGSIGVSGSYVTLDSGTGYNVVLYREGAPRYVVGNNTFFPHHDNLRNLGALSNRWDDVYATNALIQTSDRNEKQDIAELDEAERRVAVAAKGLLRKFRWKDAVAEKGDDARIHFGIIAQDLQAAFEAEGLDAGRYAMFIHTTWTDEETGEERSRMGVRYSELLAFIIAAI